MCKEQSACEDAWLDSFVDWIERNWSCYPVRVVEKVFCFSFRRLWFCARHHFENRCSSSCSTAKMLVVATWQSRIASCGVGLQLIPSCGPNIGRSVTAAKKTRVTVVGSRAARFALRAVSMLFWHLKAASATRSLQKRAFTLASRMFAFEGDSENPAWGFWRPLLL